MADVLPLLTSSAGVRHYLRTEGDGSIHVDSYSDVSAILERNKAMANHNDGYSPSREMRRAASIPLSIVFKWLNEEGWFALDPRNWDRLSKKLDDPDWRWLRTAPGHLGKEHRHI